MYIDLCFVKKLTFLVTRTEAVEYISLHALENGKKDTILKQLTKILKVYVNRGFIITDLFGDNEFNHDKIEERIRGINLHICAAGEHVPKIERAVRTIKEKARTIEHAMPYMRYLTFLTSSLVDSAVTAINDYPNKQSVSAHMSTSGILLGKPNPDGSKEHIEFDAYALAFTKNINTISNRAVPAVVLCQSNDEDG